MNAHHKSKENISKEIRDGSFVIFGKPKGESSHMAFCMYKMKLGLLFSDGGNVKIMFNTDNSNIQIKV